MQEEFAVFCFICKTQIGKANAKEQEVEKPSRSPMASSAHCLNKQGERWKILVHKGLTHLHN